MTSDPILPWSKLLLNQNKFFLEQKARVFESIPTASICVNQALALISNDKVLCFSRIFCSFFMGSLVDIVSFCKKFSLLTVPQDNCYIIQDHICSIRLSVRKFLLLGTAIKISLWISRGWWFKATRDIWLSPLMLSVTCTGKGMTAFMGLPESQPWSEFFTHK